jgi:chorismate mutase
MEQEGLELRQAYQKRIAEIKSQNERAIRKLVEEFKTNLLKVQEEMKDAQSATQVLKDYYEEKLRSQYDEHEMEIVKSNDSHKNKKQELENQWNELEASQAEWNTIKT